MLKGSVACSLALLMGRMTRLLWICVGALFLLAPGVALAGDNAAFVSQTTFAYKMYPGETYNIIVRMKNTGTTTWTPGGGYKLGSQNLQDNTWWGLNRVPLPVAQVAPGASVNFSFIITAPNTLGPRNMQWQMVRESVAWFGAKTANQDLVVGYPGETKVCAADEYDMVDWMTLDPDLRDHWKMTGSHILATTVWPDKIWWVKHAAKDAAGTVYGNIWDAWIYDDQSVYWYLTEVDNGMSWDDLNTARYFKRAALSTNFRAAARCQKVGVIVNVPDTRYVIHQNCAETGVLGLKGARYTVSAPALVNLGGDLGARTVLKLTEDYNCDAAGCSDHETWYLDRRYGLVRWERSGSANQVTTFSSWDPGTVRPYFPCY